MYLNLITGEFISSDRSVKETGKGLMYYQDGCWKFLSKDEYQEYDEAVETLASGGTLSYEDVGIDELINTDSLKTKQYKYYTSYFGLNRLDIKYKKFIKTSGCVSDDIQVYKGIPLKLKLSKIIPDYTSVEFSVIDGEKETPITPCGDNIVTNEKVFFNIRPRMTADGTYNYYRNFVKINNFTGTEEDIFDSDVLYTVSYTADSSYQIYIPQNTTVKLKTVIRIYKDNVISPQIIAPVLTQGVS